MEPRRRRWNGISKATRDAVLFIGGLVGVADEALFHHGDVNPYLLGAYVGFIFAVPALRLGEYIKQTGGK